MVTLTNVGLNYDAIAASQGLGFIEEDLTGVTQVLFKVRYQKVASLATNVLTWQLWDETDGTEIGTIVDNNGPLTSTQVRSAPFSLSKTGSHTLRVRVKSSVAADDPIYLGSSIKLVRP